MPLQVSRLSADQEKFILIKTTIDFLDIFL